MIADNKIIVIGADYHNTLGIVRSLGRAGIAADVIALGNVVDGFVDKSKYIGDFYRCQSHDEILNVLQSYNGRQQKTILLTASDEIASLIDNNANSLNADFVFPNCGPQGSLTKWLNKRTMGEQAASVGLTVPLNVIYHKGDRLPENIEYPCITKAISSIEGHKSDTVICKNSDELEAFTSTNERLCSTIQIEKFIDKEFEFQFFGLSLNGGEEIIIPGHSHIYRPGIQNEYYFKYIENDGSFDETLAKTKSFIKSVSYSGTFSVEFVRGKDGVDYFLEMNFRNDGNAICVTDAGYNLPYIWYLFNCGGDYRNEINHTHFRKVDFCPDMIYFWHMMAGELSLREWWKTRIISNSFTMYDKDDKKPYYCHLLDSMPSIIKALISKSLKQIGLRKR